MASLQADDLVKLDWHAFQPETCLDGEGGTPGAMHPVFDRHLILVPYLPETNRRSGLA